jgi:hypothetical protein
VEDRIKELENQIECYVEGEAEDKRVQEAIDDFSAESEY